MKQLACLILVFIVWFLLTWSLAPQQVLAGLVLSILVSLFLSDVYPQNPARLISPKRWLWGVLYIPYFLYFVFKANLDVAYRVLHPDLPIHPGIVKVKTELKSDLGRTFLANSITLTPGTLSVDIEDGYLYVHWLNITTFKEPEQTEIIVNRFEKFLKEIFE